MWRWNDRFSLSVQYHLPCSCKAPQKSLWETVWKALASAGYSWRHPMPDWPCAAAHSLAHRWALGPGGFLSWGSKTLPCLQLQKQGTRKANPIKMPFVTCNFILLCPEFYEPTRQALWLVWENEAYQLPMNFGTGNCFYCLYLECPFLPSPFSCLSGDLLFIFQNPVHTSMSFLKFILRKFNAEVGKESSTK